MGKQLTVLFSSATFGLQSEIITVEVDTSQALPGIVIVGLPDTAVSESRERIRSAIKNTGFTFPDLRFTINLAPADFKKVGPLYDLPLAVGVLFTSGQLPEEARNHLQKSIFLGELGLTGEVRGVEGVLPSVIKAKKEGFQKIFVPHTNANEASLVQGVEIYSIKNLKELTDHLLEGKLKPYLPSKESQNLKKSTALYDFSYIRGQKSAKRVLEIAASGGHNVSFSGPPGSGKTLLARTLPTILPQMNYEEALEVTKIYSIAGLLLKENPLITERPFRAPHHSISGVALIGGGTWPTPGELSLAHRGVLFLDEFPEFPRGILEQLRQPLEDGNITISRISGTLTFPARIILVTSQNPCPCGFASDPDRGCRCSLRILERYRQKISGPLLDRIDLFMEVPRLSFFELSSKESQEENSEHIRSRVETAREIQEIRFQSSKIFTNSEMTQKFIREFCKLSFDSQKLLEMALHNFHLSPRSYFRIQKVARTIADLEGSTEIKKDHIAEAIQYRITT